jgi:ethanolamine utilization protein EutA
MAAFGSGAVALSGRTRQRVLNVHIGVGTSKLALCENGAIRHISAIDIGARVVAFDTDRRVTRLEEAGKYFAKQAGVTLMLGAVSRP